MTDQGRSWTAAWVEAGTEALPRLALRPSPEEIAGAVLGAVAPLIRAQVLDEVIHALRDEGHSERAVWCVEQMAADASEKPYWAKCPRCGQEFDAPGLLTAHTEDEHPEGVPPDDFMQVPDHARRTT